MLALQKNPEDYLFPLIQEWPIPSRTAETLIIRREGEYALFLNDLRFQKNTALDLRIPLTSRDVPAMKAALGREGIVEGRDYRGVPVIADVRAVPDSPWFLVARMDTEEVYAPLQERMWLMVFLVCALIAGAGAGIGLVWRSQRSRFFREQYKLSEELRESEIKFRTIFENSSSALAIIEKDTTISMVNKEYCKISGYEEKDVVGLSWMKQIPPEDLERLKEYNRKRLIDPKSAPDNYEFTFYRKDGEVRNALMSVALIPTYQKIICSFTDITERRQAEERLRELSLAVEQSPASIVITDISGAIQYVNHKFIQLTGYTLDEVIGKNPRILKSGITPAEEYAKLWSIIASGGEWRGEFHNKKKNGEMYWESAVISSITNARGDVTHFLAVKEDISERKLTEAYGDLGREILQILNEPGDTRDSMQRVLAVLKTRTGFDAAGIRLQDGNDFPYFAQEGFSKNFLLTENTLIERSSDGGLCRDKNGNVNLECTCGLVISGKTDHANSFFTPGGSWWTNDSSTMSDIPPGEDPRFHPRNRCIHQGYASVALVPIRNKERIVGLIQLNDKRKGRFTLNMVVLLEGIASNIGAALMRKQAEKALQEFTEEREKLIKELQFALDNVKTLQGLIPICANCKKIRDDSGYWNQVEGYIMKHTDAKFSHGICPDCSKELYGDLYKKATDNLSEKNI